jgi:hypothetical protein
MIEEKRKVALDRLLLKVKLKMASAPAAEVMGFVQRNILSLSEEPAEWKYLMEREDPRMSDNTLLEILAQDERCTGQPRFDDVLSIILGKEQELNIMSSGIVENVKDIVDDNKTLVTLIDIILSQRDMQERVNAVPYQKKSACKNSDCKACSFSEKEKDNSHFCESIFKLYQSTLASLVEQEFEVGFVGSPLISVVLRFAGLNEADAALLRDSVIEYNADKDDADKIKSGHGGVSFSSGRDICSLHEILEIQKNKQEQDRRAQQLREHEAALKKTERNRKKKQKQKIKRKEKKVVKEREAEALLMAEAEARDAVSTRVLGCAITIGVNEALEKIAAEEKRAAEKRASVAKQVDALRKKFSDLFLLSPAWSLSDVLSDAEDKVSEITLSGISSADALLLYHACHKANIYNDDTLEEKCDALWTTMKTKGEDKIDITVSFIEVAATVDSFIESAEQQLSADMDEFSSVVPSKSDGFCAEKYDARLFKSIGLVSESKAKSTKQHIAEDDGYVTGPSAPASPDAPRSPAI